MRGAAVRTLSLGVVDEELQHIDEVGAVEGVATDTDAGALTETLHGVRRCTTPARNSYAEDEPRTTAVV